MTSSHITQLIIEYRYLILIPLSIIEGPVVAFIAGTLASLGYFDIYAIALFFLVRDLGLDGFWYGLGYWGSNIKIVKKALTKLKITQDHMQNVKEIWDKKPMRTMFIGKLSYGISGAFIIAAGTVRMSLLKFFKYGFLATLFQYGLLIGLGYFFGNALGADFANKIQNVTYIVGIGLLVLSAFYIFMWYMRKKFMKNEKEYE